MTSGKTSEKFLVTRANGFIGSNLISDLKMRKNAKVISVVRNDNKSFVGNSTQVKFEECDLTKYDRVESLIKKYKPDYIIHLATEGLRSRHWSNPAKVLTDNYPVADRIMENSFVIGCHQGITSTHINYVKAKFDEFFKKNS